MSALESVLDREHADQRARAIRTLLARPLLTSDRDSFTFNLVVRHRDWLRRWFDGNAGWELHVEPRQPYARLTKRRSDPDPTRPARRTRGARAPFDRRRYVLLCVTLAELARGHAQTTIGLLASRVTATCAADEQLTSFNSSEHRDRTAFVDALKLLETWQVIVAEAGDTDTFRSDTDAKVLYTVDETRLGRLLASATSPSRADETDDPLAALTAEPRYGTDPAGPDTSERARNRWARHTVMRRLIDDPVVYPHELHPTEAAYLRSPTGARVIRDALTEAGLALETRADGWVVIDPDAIATLPDDKFPDERNHVKHAALLLIECVSGARFGADADPDMHGPPAAPISRFETHVEGLMRRFPTWAKTYQGDRGPATLTAAAVRLLVAHKLAVHNHDTVVLLPAAARYASVTSANVAIADDPAAPPLPFDQPTDNQPPDSSRPDPVEPAVTSEMP